MNNAKFQLWSQNLWQFKPSLRLEWNSDNQLIEFCSAMHFFISWPLYRARWSVYVSESYHDLHNAHDDCDDNDKHNANAHDSQHTTQQVPNFIHIIFVSYKHKELWSNWDIAHNATVHLNRAGSSNSSVPQNQNSVNLRTFLTFTWFTSDIL